MNRKDDTTAAAELEEQRQAQTDRRHADYGNCDPVGAELLMADDSLTARWLERVADRRSQG
ncbi:hypothetical protein [Streptomyces sp. NPDC057616]|uniref:hypothetical protein n=1 Tax=Streptomyces sp. NPDC057616 TaxID=3346183 RepID=UPI00369E87F9